MNYAVDRMNADDWEQVRSIYVEGIRAGDATFETEAPSWEKWDAGHLQSGRLVARKETDVLGWAALSSVSGRCVYGGVAEVSVYVGENARGKAWGALYSKHSSKSRNETEFGRFRPGYFQRTRRAWNYICGAAFVRSAGASGSGS